jgi:hypothetical protein
MRIGGKPNGEKANSARAGLGSGPKCTYSRLSCVFGGATLDGLASTDGSVCQGLAPWSASVRGLQAAFIAFYSMGEKVRYRKEASRIPCIGIRCIVGCDRPSFRRSCRLKMSPDSAWDETASYHALIENARTSTPRAHARSSTLGLQRAGQSRELLPDELERSRPHQLVTLLMRSLSMQVRSPRHLVTQACFAESARLGASGSPSHSIAQAATGVRPAGPLRRA